MRPEEQAPAPVEPGEAQVIEGLRGLYAAETQELTRALERGREPGWRRASLAGWHLTSITAE